jgi:hypothetical protein
MVTMLEFFYFLIFPLFYLLYLLTPPPVIPAKAGIHGVVRRTDVDPLLQGDDDEQVLTIFSEGMNNYYLFS